MSTDKCLSLPLEDIYTLLSKLDCTQCLPYFLHDFQQSNSTIHEVFMLLLFYWYVHAYHIAIFTKQNRNTMRILTLTCIKTLVICREERNHKTYNLMNICELILDFFSKQHFPALGYNKRDFKKELTERLIHLGKPVCKWTWPKQVCSCSFGCQFYFTSTSFPFDRQMPSFHAYFLHWNNYRGLFSIHG